jgi:hypothetical protein
MFAKTVILLSIGAVVQGRAWPRPAVLLDVATVNVLATAATVVYDGRVKANATTADFDTTTGPFGSEFVKGQSESDYYLSRWCPVLLTKSRRQFQRTDRVPRSRAIDLGCSGWCESG